MENNITSGLYAADYLTTGVDNIFIGVNAGRNCTTGSRNIIIAHNVELPTPDTCDYCNIGGVEIDLSDNVGKEMRKDLKSAIDNILGKVKR